jgi:signal transduction histidine kinase
MNDRKALANKLLFAITTFFSLFVFFNLITWANYSDRMLFAWTFLGVLQGVIAILSVYIAHIFVTGRELPVIAKSALLACLFVVTGFNLAIGGFNITNCGAFEFDGAASLSATLLGSLSIVWILALLVYGYRRNVGIRKKEILIFCIGLESFLLLFFFITQLASYLQTAGFTEDSRLEMYALFGMDIFALFLAYLIIRFKAFNARLLGAQALVVSLVALIGSLFFFFYDSSRTVLILLSSTFVLACIGGYFLIKSVKKEVEQRRQIEKLATDLEKANEHLKVLDKMKSEFVSIASHQLRSPITAIRGYVSMLVEGSYGKFPDKAREVLDRISESSKFMASSIEDYLNVSRIEAGNMKYELSDFDLKEQAERVSDELRQVALKKGLILLFRSDIKGSGMVNADIGKTRQVIMNFIDNSIKYTPKGTITVIAHDDPSKKKMWITITDTGIGMSEQTLSEVFDKFIRAKNANQVNVTGTGLGLYVAKKMAAGMGGKVWAESEGEGKGSSFFIEFPELSNNPGK